MYIHLGSSNIKCAIHRIRCFSWHLHSLYMTLNSEVNIYFSASDLSDRHHSKSTKDLSTNFLLQFMLLQTTPVVTRLLSVRPKTFFETLHKYIETTFGWSENEASNGKTLLLFLVVQGSQLEIGGPKGMKVFV